MKLLTWNLGSKPKPKEPPNFDNLDNVIEYLEGEAATDLVIACLQELPISPDQLYARLNTPLGLLTCTRAKAKAILVYSRLLKASFARSDRTGRGVITRFTTPTGGTIGVVGIHFHDQLTLDRPEARGAAFSLLRINIDEVLGTEVPIVILGDFNSEPDAQELAHPFCFFSRAPRDRVVNAQKHATGAPRRPLFTIIPAEEQGTFYYARERGWRTLDFLIVSESLKPVVTSAEVRGSLLGRSLKTKGSVALPGASDHLPVVADIHFQ